MLLSLKALDKHVFLTCLPDLKQDDTYTFSIDGQAFTKSLEARVDAILVLKVNKEGKRALLTQNDGAYPAKLRLPGDKTIDRLVTANIEKLFKTIGYI